MNKEQAIQKIDDIINAPKQDYAVGDEGTFSADECNAIVTLLKNFLNLNISDDAAGLKLNDSVLVKTAYTNSWGVKTVSSIRQPVDNEIRQSSNPVSSNAVYQKVKELLADISARATSAEMTAAVTALQQQIDAIVSFEYTTVNTLPIASANTKGRIYLVPSPNQQSGNVKDEYITIQNGSLYSWEQIGSTEVDLSGYSTTAEMNAVIEGGFYY